MLIRVLHKIKSLFIRFKNELRYIIKTVFGLPLSKWNIDYHSDTTILAMTSNDFEELPIFSFLYRKKKISKILALDDQAVTIATQKKNPCYYLRRNTR